MTNETEGTAPGRLLAVDGSRAKDVQAAAGELMTKLRAAGRACGVSQWDASGTFSDVMSAKRRNLALSPRTIVLLYAADLAFRLRWEIEPALGEGSIVVAAPYVATIVTWGEAAGLPRIWLRELFRFAPKPGACYRAEERKKKAGWSGKSAKGLGEFSAGAGVVADAGEQRRRMIERLDRLEARKECVPLTRAALKDAVKPPH